MDTQSNGGDPLAVRANKLDLLEQVADDLAHEIRNPLHSMVINLEVLKRRITRSEASGSADLLRYTDVLGSELERVSHRVDLLLRIVRPARQDEHGPIQEILEELRELVEVEAARRVVGLDFEPAGLGARGTAPRETARQVILNLVLTVLDRLRPGDTLNIGTALAAGAVEVRVSGAPAAATAGALDAGGALDADGALDAGGAGAAPGADPAGSRLKIAGLLSGEIGGAVRATAEAGAYTLTFSLPAAT